MGKNITLHKANIADAADLTILDNIASTGLSLWFWQNAKADWADHDNNVSRAAGDEIDAYEWGRNLIIQADTLFGYKNAVIAKLDNKVAGAAVGYVYHGNDNNTLNVGNSVLDPIFDLFSLCEGDWLLDNLAVYNDYRKIGIGAILLDDCFRRAKAANADEISLVAADDNANAIDFYNSRGFVERKRRKFVAYKQDSKTKYWVLLSAQTTRIS